MEVTEIVNSIKKYGSLEKADNLISGIINVRYTVSFCKMIHCDPIPVLDVLSSEGFFADADYIEVVKNIEHSAI